MDVKVCLGLLFKLYNTIIIKEEKRRLFTNITRAHVHRYLKKLILKVLYTNKKYLPYFNTF